MKTNKPLSFSNPFASSAVNTYELAYIIPAGDLAITSIEDYWICSGDSIAGKQAIIVAVHSSMTSSTSAVVDYDVRDAGVINCIAWLKPVVSDIDRRSFMAVERCGTIHLMTVTAGHTILTLQSISVMPATAKLKLILSISDMQENGEVYIGGFEWIRKVVLRRVHF